MSGFLLEIEIIDKKHRLALSNSGNHKKIASKHKIKYTGKSKFPKDNCFFENEDYLVVLDGVVLNKKDILSKSSFIWEEQLIDLYKNKGDCFFKDFRGSFRGVFFDKTKDKWIIYQDHIGSKNIFFSNPDPHNFIFSSDISNVLKCRKTNKIEDLDIQASYMLLTYGYMLQDHTLSKEIKRMDAGTYCKIENGSLTKHEFYKLDNTPNNDLTEREIIHEMDKLFSQAIKRQFEKDKEYGYKHFVALSGGLDSRMTALVANKLGYKNQLNFTFSQTNYLDETIAKKISSDLKHEWIFKSLDNGLFLMDIEEIVKFSGGVLLFHGIGHGFSLYKHINFSKLGIVHSGQLGDVIFGTYDKNPLGSSRIDIGEGAYSKKLIHRLNHKNILKTMDTDYELYLLNQRGLIGINDGLTGIQQITETMSPFYDVDVLNFALTIPLKYRHRQKIYKKWILQKHPESALYNWEKTGDKINAPSLNIFGKEVTYKKLLRKVYVKLGLVKYGYASKKNMNPIDYWLNTNKELRDFFESYFSMNIDKIKNQQLRDDCRTHFNNGTGVEKIQVLTLLSSVKLFFSSN